MRIGSLFSGIGGLELGLERAIPGAHTVWQVEQSAFCRSILARHWPDAERFDDVRTAGVGNLAPVDLICGGFPCQDVSSAGKGAGLAGERSGLWFEFARIVGELRPEWVVIENVASGANRWVDAIMAGMGQLDYQALPVPLSAHDVGAPHLRRRVFIVAHAACLGRAGEGKPQQDMVGNRREPPQLRHGQGKTEGGVGGPTADANSKQLREQQGRGCGTSREGPPEPGDAGPAWSAADATGNRRSAEGERAETGHPNWGCELRHGIETGRIPSPRICGVANGIPHRLDRLRALGNAVVPQCAEVIGHIVNELSK